MSKADSKAERSARLTAAMRGAGCIAPRDWVNSEISEDIPQFARFLMLQEVHVIADDVELALGETLFDRPELAPTLAALRAAVDPEALHALLRAYGKSLGNTFVSVIDDGHSHWGEGVPSWQLMETDSDGEPTGRLVCGLHEDYLDFEENYVPRAPAPVTG